METVSRSGLLLWDRTVLKSVRSGPVPVPRSGPASLATGDETIGDAQIFEDAASYQISDNNSSINNTWAEKQKDSRTYYLTHGIVTVKISPHWSSLGI